MAKNAIFFIIIFILSFLFCSFVIHKLNQQESYLLQLKSSLETIYSTYASIMEKSIFDINEEDIAKFENINFQLAQIADSLEKYKNQLKKLNLEMEEFIDSGSNKKFEPIHEDKPDLKNEMLNFISNLKPHFHFLTSKISEISLVSFNTLVTSFEKLQNSATPLIMELYESAIPYIMKMSMWLLSVLEKGLNEFFQFFFEAARWCWNHMIHY